MGHFYLFVRLGEEVILLLFPLHMHNFFSDKSDWKSKSWARYQRWTMAFFNLLEAKNEEMEQNEEEN